MIDVAWGQVNKGWVYIMHELKAMCYVNKTFIDPSNETHNALAVKCVISDLLMMWWTTTVVGAA